MCLFPPEIVLLRNHIYYSYQRHPGIYNFMSLSTTHSIPPPFFPSFSPLINSPHSSSQQLRWMNQPAVLPSGNRQPGGVTGRENSFIGLVQIILMTTPCPVHARAEDLLRDLHLVPWEAQGRVRVEKAPFCQLSQALGSHRGCWSTKGLKG